MLNSKPQTVNTLFSWEGSILSLPVFTKHIVGVESDELSSDQSGRIWQVFTSFQTRNLWNTFMTFQIVGCVCNQMWVQKYILKLSTWDLGIICDFSVAKSVFLLLLNGLRKAQLKYRWNLWLLYCELGHRGRDESIFFLFVCFHKLINEKKLN